MATSILQSRLKLSDPDLALLCVPANYVDCRRPMTRLADAKDDGETAGLFSLRVTGNVRAFRGDKEPMVLNGEIVHSFATLQEQGYHRWKEFKRLAIELEDDEGQLATLSVFDVLAWRTRAPAAYLDFIGKIKRLGPNLFASIDVMPPSNVIGGIWTRYLGIPGQVSADTVTQAVERVLDSEAAYLKAEREIVSALQVDEGSVLQQAQAHLAGSRFAAIAPPRGLRAFLTQLHRPATVEAGHQALALAKAMSALGIRAAVRMQSKRHPHPQAPLIVPDEQVLALAVTQREQLTADQRAAALGIAKALRSPVPLNGLLSGDVGTGKTLTFLLPAVAAHNNGAAVAIVAPTEILANQIAAGIAGRFGTQIRGVERVGTGKKIRNPDHILVGTAGLATSCAKAGIVPNLLVLDEQHKLSVATRSALVSPSTHVLEASATPIPRSLATVFLDGMQVFSLREAPVERAIKTHVVDVSERGEVTRAMRRTIAEGRRVLIVYPRLETIEIGKKAKAKAEGEGAEPELSFDGPPELDDGGQESKRSAQGVLDAAKAFEQAFPGKVAVLHGLMSGAEKDAVIEQVKSLEKQVVVASVVVETGIDIPDIGLLLVRDANYLGLAQLHQLRGRLARNGGAAECFMMVEDLLDLAPPALERLYAVRAVTDGYLLAEIDMRQRGFGSYVDDGQTGATRGVFRLLRHDAGELVDELAADDEGRQAANGTRVDVDRLMKQVDVDIAKALQARADRAAVHGSGAPAALAYAGARLPNGTPPGARPVAAATLARPGACAAPAPTVNPQWTPKPSKGFAPSAGFAPRREAPTEPARPAPVAPARAAVTGFARAAASAPLPPPRPSTPVGVFPGGARGFGFLAHRGQAGAAGAPQQGLFEQAEEPDPADAPRG